MLMVQRVDADGPRIVCAKKFGGNLTRACKYAIKVQERWWLVRANRAEHAREMIAKLRNPVTDTGSDDNLIACGERGALHWRRDVYRMWS